MKSLSIIAILLILFTAQNCTGNRAEYVFLITLDTTRADFIDYSQGNKTTPNLAELASRGFYFNNAYSVIPITLPSHASMLYSLYPHSIRILNNGEINREKHVSLPQILKKFGYSTSAVISLGVLKSDFKLNRGFDLYMDSFKDYIWTKSAEEVNSEAMELIKNRKKGKNFFWIHYSDPHEPYYPAYSKGKFSVLLNKTPVLSIKATVNPYIKTVVKVPPGKSKLIFHTEIPRKNRRIPFYEVDYLTYKDFEISGDPAVNIVYPKTWRNRGRGKPDFYTEDMISEITLTNSGKVEVPLNLKFLYSMHEKTKYRRSLYALSISYMDKKVGELIDFLKKNGILKKSVFVIMGDHGEGLGEYMNNWGHIHYLNKLYSRVPFIVSGQAVKSEGKREELVSNLNIAPTILDLCGIKSPGFMEGESVLKKIRKKKLIIETFSPEAYFDAFSLIEFPYQIIFYPGRREKRIEFTNLLTDTLGISGISGPGVEKIKKKMLKSILNISRTITATKRTLGKTERVHREILKSLGYL